MSVETFYCIPRDVHLTAVFYSDFLLQNWRMFRIFYLYVIFILTFMQVFRYILMFVSFCYKKLSLFLIYIMFGFVSEFFFVYGSIPIFSRLIMSSSDRLSLSLQVNSTYGALRPIQRLKWS